MKRALLSWSWRASGGDRRLLTFRREEIAPEWPPPPHDPRERELAVDCEGWEARLFTGRKFQYFVTRGFWHLQLWHPSAGVSVLTPSRLTQGAYEAYPSANWRASAPDYEKLVSLLAGVSPARLPSAAAVAMLERRLVDAVVRSALAPRVDLQ